jgi:hypothetical protein
MSSTLQGELIRRLEEKGIPAETKPGLDALCRAAAEIRRSYPDYRIVFHYETFHYRNVVASWQVDDEVHQGNFVTPVTHTNTSVVGHKRIVDRPAWVELMPVTELEIARAERLHRIVVGLFSVMAALIIGVFLAFLLGPIIAGLISGA